MATHTGITTTQKRVLDYIVRYTAGHGYPPTFREIAEACRFKSLSTVSHHLRRLQDAGYLSLTPKIARGATIRPQPPPT